MTSDNNAVPQPLISIGMGSSFRTALGDKSVAKLLRGVTCYVERVASDLHLPQPCVQGPHEVASQDGFEIVINGVSCRVPVVRDCNGGQPPSPQAVESRIARIIHVNRELLVDDRIAQAVRAERSSAESGLYLAGLSRSAFFDYLRKLVRGCFHVDRGDYLNDPKLSPTQSWTASACYEEAVRPLSRLQCSLYHAPGSVSTTAADDEPIERLLALMQEDLFYELGIRFPQVHLKEDQALTQLEFRIQINDLQLPRAVGLADSEVLVNDTPEGLRLLDIEGRAAANPATGAEAAIVTGDAAVAKATCDAGLTRWGRNGYLVLACSGELRRHAASFIVCESVEHDLDLLRHWYSGVITSARERFGTPAIVQVMRNLVEEGISVRHLHGVLEAMLAVSSTADVDFGEHIVFPPYAVALCPAVFGKRIQDVEPAGYAECVRSRFKEYVSQKYTRGQSTLVAFLLDRKLERRVAQSRQVPLTEQERSAIRKAVEKEIGRLRSASAASVILTTLEARKPFRQLVEVEFPNMGVLAYQELSPTLSIQPLGRISTDSVEQPSHTER